MNQKKIRVAIGLIVEKGKILVGWRDEKLHQGGCYEFAGGKVEADESPKQAVKREILEEVGIDVDVIRLFDELVFDYCDRIVHLFFYQCYVKSGEMLAGWQWVEFDQLSQLTFPAANQPIIERLAWQRRLAISPQWQMFKQQQLKPQLDLCYLRLQSDDILPAIDLLAKNGDLPKLIVQRDHYLLLDDTLKHNIFAVHLNSLQLHQYQDLTIFAKQNVIAACHRVQDIQQANRLGCDAILLSPVCATPTHPQQQPLGWDTFAQWVKHAKMPVYALGGVQCDDLALAQQYGAFGVAGIRDFWTG